MNTIAEVLKRQGYKPKANYPKKLLISFENGEIRIDEVRDCDVYEEDLESWPQTFMTIEPPK